MTGILNYSTKLRSTGFSPFVPFQRNKVRSPILFLISTIFLFPSLCFAIPSPDVLVNVFASAGQVLGLLSVGLGATLFGGERSKSNAKSGVSRIWIIGGSLLLFASISANVLQYAANQDAINKRLEQNLVRPSVEEGRKVGDVSLRDLSFSDQQKHPSGVTSEDFARMLAEPNFHEKYQLIDVRNLEEIEMGHIAGTVNVLQPDLREQQAKYMESKKPFFLLCDSGNRSGELCDDFSQHGYPCQFMIGGYEKWIAEGRPIVEQQASFKGEIRDIPEYPNKRVLLQTEEVLQLLNDEKAIFVDVRYPGDFEISHLPGAINIPLRKLTTDAMWASLKALPKQPIIAPCYDKRSCFYGLILGIRLHRLGYDYRGRYTVPAEFMVAKPEKEYVLKWRQENQRTFFGLLRQPLNALFAQVSSGIHNLPFAILVFVLMLRVLFMPIAFKAERDQHLQRKYAPERTKLLARVGNDPVRMNRATKAWNKKNHLTLGFNLFGSLLQMLVFILCFGVIESFAKEHPAPFLWVQKAVDIDGSYLLPIFVALSFPAFMALNAQKHSAWRWAARFAGGALFLALCSQLSIALNFYLASSLVFMFGQTLLFKWWLNRSGNKTSADADKTDEGVFPLHMAHKVSGAGAKAARLGQMLEAGLPVPNGFVITEKLFARNNMEDETDELSLSPTDAKRLAELRGAMKSRNVAVRSSGLNEDGASQSYAGVFESIVNVKPYEFGAAVQDVRASLSSERVVAYSGNQRERGGILVQEMVEAEFAGVLFTEHPAESGAILVELTQGLGDALVSGSTNAQAFRFGRTTLALLDVELPPIDLPQLLQLGLRVEKLFGAPQDIEWAYAKGEFLILQARNITRLSRSQVASASPRTLMEEERHRLLKLSHGASADAVIFAQSELSELLPRPTPMSLSMMERLWSPGGSTDLACRALRIPYEVPEESDPLLVTVFGALYINKLEEKRRGTHAPGALAAFRLSRMADELSAHFQNEFLPTLTKSIEVQRALDLKRFEVKSLLQHAKDAVEKFITETYVTAEKINVAADFYMKSARTALEKEKLPTAEYLSHLPPNVTFKAMSLLPHIQAGTRPVSDFLALYGHRSAFDYELSELRYSEHPEAVSVLASAPYTNGREHQSSTPTLKSKYLAKVVERACKFQALKEDAKHYALMEYAELRRIFCEIGSRLEIGDNIFFLTLEEILAEGAFVQTSKLKALAKFRRVQAEAFGQVTLPVELTATDLETLTIDVNGAVHRRKQSSTGEAGDLSGTTVAGSAPVEGVARVIVDESDMLYFRPGEILVTRFTNPRWTPLFSQARGVVTEIGGWLSHAAILAREYNLTTIVGVKDVIDTIKTGDYIRLQLNGMVERIPNPKQEGASHERPTVSA